MCEHGIGTESSQLFTVVSVLVSRMVDPKLLTSWRVQSSHRMDMRASGHRILHLGDGSRQSFEYFPNV